MGPEAKFEQNFQNIHPINVRLALYQPDIPQNTGALLRLAACFGVPVEVIEPCGFVWSNRRLERAGMDYAKLALVTRHSSWEKFHTTVPGRIILLTTTGSQNHIETEFTSNDILLLGRESSGVPNEIHTAADLRVRISMASGLRSLNVAIAGAIVLGEALRQTNGFPDQQAK